jgi:sugar/nucleoside kinase (ribokinase family)
MEPKHYDFIAIGDTVTDAFIRIKAASVFRMEDEDGMTDEELCFPSGAKVPYEFAKVLAGVGNSANAAVSAARLGLSSALIADVGSDDFGKEIRNTIAAQGVGNEYVRTHEGKTTNYHYVLWHGAERTILIKHEEYPYALPKDLPEPKWIYFSSVGEHGISYHDEIADYLDAHPNVKLAFQPGTFQIKLGKDRLARLYSHADFFVCNVEEARIILQTSESNPAKLPAMISAFGPKVAVITDGPKGLYAHDKALGKTYYLPQYPDPKPPYERTGAGDACASTIAVGLSQGLPLSEALLWGPINSMSVVQYVGAQEGLLSREALLRYLKDAPAEYKVTEVAA